MNTGTFHMEFVSRLCTNVFLLTVKDSQPLNGILSMSTVKPEAT